MLVTKPSRYKNSYVSINRTEPFRDKLIVLGKKTGQVVFLTTFNNSYATFEIITNAVANGTYKIKITSTDNLGNENTGIEGTVVVANYPLPPVNLEAVAGTVALSDVTLTWEHSVEGAPDSYVIYSNNGTGTTIDRTSPVATISGALLTYVHTTPIDGDWRYVVESVVSGVESNSQNIVFVTVPYTEEAPEKPGPGGSLAVTGISLENVSIGKVKFSFLWIYGDNAANFRLYYDNGTGTVDYNTPLMTIARANQLVQTGTTDRLHVTNEEITYKFSVRAVNSAGVEETNTDTYSIVVDGLQPDDAIDLSLDTIY